MSEATYWTSLKTGLSRRRMFRTGIMAASGLAGAAILGCGSDDDAPPATTAPGTTVPGTTAPGAGTPAGTQTPDTGSGQARRGGQAGFYVTVGAGTNDPTRAPKIGHELLGSHVYDRLLSPRQLDDREYVLEAAETVELADETTVVFTLRDGLVFQDKEPVNGRPVVAEDIVQAQHYSRDSEQARNNAFQRSTMESIEAPDDRTVIINLQRPNAYLFSSSQLGEGGGQCIIPSEILDELDTHDPIGSGPYHLKEYQVDVSYLFERSPSYHGADEPSGVPYLDEVMGLIISDPTAQETAFRGEQVHVYRPTSQEFANRVVADLDDQLTVQEFKSLGFSQWGPSQARGEVLQDVRVREAMYRALNQAQMIELIDAGLSEAPPGVLSTALEAWLIDGAETEEYWRHDPEAARQLLDAAGFDFGQTYSFVTYPGDASLLAQVLDQQLSEVGVRVQIETMQFADFLPLLGTGAYDFMVTGHAGYDAPQQPMRFHHTQTNHLTAHHNLRDPEVDAMIESAEEAVDREQNIELVKQAQVAVLERYTPFIVLRTPFLKELTWAYLKDWELTVPVQPIYRLDAWLDV